MIYDWRLSTFPDGRMVLYALCSFGVGFSPYSSPPGPIETGIGGAQFCLLQTAPSGRWRRMWTHLGYGIPRRMAVAADMSGLTLLFSLNGDDRGLGAGEPIEQDGRVLYSHQDALNGEWMNWNWGDQFPIDNGNGIREIDAVSDSTGLVHLFAIFSDLQIYLSAFTPGALATNFMAPWVPLGGARLNEIRAARTTDGRPRVYGRTIDGDVIYIERRLDGSWSPTTSLAGEQLRLISPVGGSGITSALYALGGDNSVYFRTEQQDGVWSNWSSLQGVDVRQIVAAHNADGRHEVFAVGSDGALYHRWLDDRGEWQAWTPLGGRDIRGVAVSLDSNGSLNVVAIYTNGIENEQFATIKQYQANGDWADWVTLPANPIMPSPGDMSASPFQPSGPGDNTGPSAGGPVTT